MTSGPLPESAAVAAGSGQLRASPAEREHAIDTLKVAYVQGRLARDEFDERIAQALGARTCSDLAAVSADLPPGLAGPWPPRRLMSQRVSNGAKWCAAGLVTPAILTAALVSASAGYLAVVCLVALLYFARWLSVGADMLWEWHCMSVPSAGMCVRCAHTAAAHRTSASCSVRLGSVKVWTRCPCAGYVPPGRSPKTVDLPGLVASRRRHGYREAEGSCPS